MKYIEPTTGLIVDVISEERKAEYTDRQGVVHSVVSNIELQTSCGQPCRPVPPGDPELLMLQCMTEVGTVDLIRQF